MPRKAAALPIIKIEPATDWYDYEAKYTRDDTKYALGSVLNHVLLHQTVIGLEAKTALDQGDQTLMQVFVNTRLAETWELQGNRIAEADIQKVTDKHIADIDKLIAAKEQEIMAV